MRNCDNGLKSYATGNRTEVQGSNIEVAGFEFSAGAAHACIETSGGLWKVNIHHNFFAWQDAAKYGIWLSNTTDNADCPHWHIWNN